MRRVPPISGEHLVFDSLSALNVSRPDYTRWMWIGNWPFGPVNSIRVLELNRSRATLGERDLLEYPGERTSFKHWEVSAFFTLARRPP